MIESFPEAQIPTSQFTRSLDHLIGKASSKDVLQEQLHTYDIPETHAFLPDPDTLRSRLEILSDMLATSLNDKLSFFKSIDQEQPGLSLADVRQMNDIEIQEYETANAELSRNITRPLIDLYKETHDTLSNHIHALEGVKHGVVERFTENYISYHEVAASALSEKAERSLEASIEAVYTPELLESLANESRSIKTEIPKVQAELHDVNANIQEYEQAQTPEYVAAVEQYQRLKHAVEQAQEDINKLLHYKDDR